jgi:hypothetical protein
MNSRVFYLLAMNRSTMKQISTPVLKVSEACKSPHVRPLLYSLGQSMTDISMASSSTSSVRSSVCGYIQENGRQYHRYKEGSEYFRAHHAAVINNPIRIPSA